MSATIEQQAAPPPATTKWVPVGPGMAGIPTPVVNGQWIKGVGGAATWAPISPTDVLGAPVNGQWLKGGPGGAVTWAALTAADIDAATVGGRLAGNTSTALVTDWNNATASGWYTGISAANCPQPDPGWLLGMVVAHNPSWPRQEVWAFTAGPNPSARWIRQSFNGAWSAWRLMDYPPTNVNPINGWSHYGAPYGPARYWKRNGVVFCDGLLNVGSSAIAFNFPTGWIPAEQLIFLAAASGFAGAGVGEVWRVDQGGNMVFSLPAGAGGWVSISGVQFYGDN